MSAQPQSELARLRLEWCLRWRRWQLRLHLGESTPAWPEVPLWLQEAEAVEVLDALLEVGRRALELLDALGPEQFGGSGARSLAEVAVEIAELDALSSPALV